MAAPPAPDVDEDAFAFFDRVRGKLRIELSEPPQRIGQLHNVAATPSARITRLAFETSISENVDPGPLEPDEQGRVMMSLDDASRPLTPQELARVVLRAPFIRMKNLESEGEVDHPAPPGGAFTVADLLRAIEETERQLRPRSEWLGGVDVSHVFYEGIRLEEDGAWLIQWGS